MNDFFSNPGADPSDNDWRRLAGQLGIDLQKTPVEGPRRGALSGPTDEAPLDKMLRLSAQMEELAAEIASLRSATYRAQLWHQWDALWRSRPEHQTWRRRAGPQSDEGGANPFV
ncbi:MAG TPA: hypothetical protein PKA20_02195 [Burkholderiaceae bacterium]|nr:hypothetical protein [Burkholderiaceae bacterium]